MSQNIVRALARRFGRRRSKIERRAFVQRLLAVGAASALGAIPANASFSAGKRVAIIGAGFAGLSCGFELSRAGCEVTIIEAKRRVGGRVFSSNARNRNEFLPSKNVEFGAELIGSNHPRWMHYASQFELDLLDVTDDQDAQLCVHLGGKRLDDVEAGRLWEGIEESLSQLNSLARDVDADAPWTGPHAQPWDTRSMAEWIASLDQPPLVRQALTLSFIADNGQLTERQSQLGFLTQVQGGGIEDYWTETEVYRCQGGNDRLASALAESIGRDRIRLGVSAVRVEADEVGVRLALSDQTTIEADVVVVSAAPTVWGKIIFQPTLPKSLSPQMGLNTKYFAKVKDRFWVNQQPRLSQYGLGDGLIQLTWEGTDNQQPDERDLPAVLVGFSGGASCGVAGAMTDSERDDAFGKEFERLFPGFSEKFIGSTFMNWPTEPWTIGSYSFPSPGQVTSIGPQLVAPHWGGRLFLAGEHTCYKFVGYMEGALQSGLRAAQQVAAQLK